MTTVSRLATQLATRSIIPTNVFNKMIESMTAEAAQHIVAGRTQRAQDLLVQVDSWKEMRKTNTSFKMAK